LQFVFPGRPPKLLRRQGGPESITTDREWIPGPRAEPVIGPAEGPTRWLASRNDREIGAGTQRYFFGSFCLILPMSAHGSRRSRASRGRRLSMVKRSAVRLGLSSFQSIGVDTGAPLRARGE
jgi:hypothetical protein